MTFATQYGNTPELKRNMEEKEKENVDGTNDMPDDKTDFITEFIARKKLQNRILGEIIDKLNNTENSNKSQTINKNKKP